MYIFNNSGQRQHLPEQNISIFSELSARTVEPSSPLQMSNQRTPIMWSLATNKSTVLFSVILFHKSKGLLTSSKLVNVNVNLYHIGAPSVHKVFVPVVFV